MQKFSGWKKKDLKKQVKRFVEKADEFMRHVSNESFFDAAKEVKKRRCNFLKVHSSKRVVHVSEEKAVQYVCVDRRKKQQHANLHH